jgi:hypothetical protein
MMKFASTVRSLTKKLADTVNATQSARADIAEVRGRISDLQRQVREATEYALPRTDVSLRIREKVKEDGDYWISQYGNSLIIGEQALASPTVAVGGVLLPGYGAQMMSWGATCAGDPARAEALLEAIVARVVYQQGPSIADRPAIHATLTRELQALEAEEEAAIDEMNTAGVQIAHRPEVIERRQLAANVRERDEQQVADRRQRQAAIDGRPKTRTVDPEAVGRTGTESRYLKTGQH